MEQTFLYATPYIFDFIILVLNGCHQKIILVACTNYKEDFLGVAMNGQKVSASPTLF